MKIKRGQTVPLTLNCFRSNYVINSSMTRNNKSFSRSSNDIFDEILLFNRSIIK